MDKKTSRTSTATQMVGVGALAQISRNKKIDSIGGTLGVAGLIILMGELIKVTIKWLIIKPCILVLKGFWLCLKYGCILYKMLFQYSYKGIKILINKYKEKRKIQKEII